MNVLKRCYGLDKWYGDRFFPDSDWAEMYENVIRYSIEQ